MKKTENTKITSAAQRKKRGVQVTCRIVCMTAGIIIFVSGFIAYRMYSKLEKELVLQASEITRAAAFNAAARVETMLMSARAEALSLFALSVVYEENAVSGKKSYDDFFKPRPEFAALISDSGLRIINEKFFLEQGLSENSIDAYLDAERELIEHAAALEEALLMLLGNPSPFFGKPLIALFFKVDGAGGALAAFFSVEVFTQLFDDSAEITFMVNARDDLLLHTTPQLIMTAKNYWREPLVRLTRQSAVQKIDAVFDDDNGVKYIGAAQKLNIAEAAVLSETNFDVVLGGLNRTMSENLMFCGAALLLAIILSAAIAFSINRFNGKILNDIEKEILEQEHLKNIFHGLPEKCRAGVDVLKSIPVYGESKNVTVLFAGLRGFRGLTKGLSPQRTLRILNSVLSMMLDSFSKTGGTADKIAGDTLMEVWGAPFSDGSPELDAVNAVRGALLLRAALVKHNAAMAATGVEAENDRKPPFVTLAIGCGINSGTMLAGLTGSVYAFTGSAVKRARLLEALNKRFGTDILISENTLGLVEKYFITEELPPVKIKGAKKPLRVFAVINVKVTKSGVEQPKPTNMAELHQILGLAGT
ncbi:MAG: adenylate/guanylate cyclase domain-containing protein [Treponema sp.]|jgi:adenylate cyclase|nr:adenylate/guanylate cyclase domain-containing protein [Treponema sp.]